MAIAAPSEVPGNPAGNTATNTAGNGSDVTMASSSKIPEDSTGNAAVIRAGSLCEADVHKVGMVMANSNGGNRQSSHNSAICPDTDCLCKQCTEQ